MKRIFPFVVLSIFCIMLTSCGSDMDTQELVGILPQILGDSTLFKTNRSLWQFSNEVLKIDILNWEKRSRNEMIGVFVM